MNDQRGELANILKDQSPYSQTLYRKVIFIVFEQSSSRKRGKVIHRDFSISALFNELL